MCQAVSSQIAISSKDLPTYVASVWLEISMSEQMSFEVASLIEGSIASRTFVRGILYYNILFTNYCPC